MRTRQRRLASCIAFIALQLSAGAAMASAGACRLVDLDGQQRVSLSGLLTFKVFPGAPNFTDVRSGDQPEPSYILNLDEPVCVKGGDQGNGPSKPIGRVHLIPPVQGSGDRVQASLRSAKDRHVEATTISLDVAMSAHHHAPLLAEVSSVVPDGEGIPGLEPLGTTTVRGFYSALTAGDGMEAAKFLVPELRSKGPLSARALSSYYSTLRSPLKLADVRPLGVDTFEATYSFVSNAGACTGRSVVETSRRGDLVLITHIHSLTGC